MTEYSQCPVCNWTYIPTRFVHRDRVPLHAWRGGMHVCAGSRQHPRTVLIGRVEPETHDEEMEVQS